MRVTLVIAATFIVASLTGCGSKKDASNQPSVKAARVLVKRVPCRLRLGPLAAAIELDLGEMKDLILDAKQLYDEIVNGEPSQTPPDGGAPVVMVIDKKANKFTYFRLTPNVKELRLKTKKADEVQLNVKNQEPLQVELWVNTDEPVYMEVEFKEGVAEDKK